MLRYAPGSTNISVQFHLDTAGITIADMKLGYIRQKDGDGTSFTEVLSGALTELATITTAHTDNFAKYLDADVTGGNQFILRVDFPDAAFATGKDRVILTVYDDGLNVIGAKEANLEAISGDVNLKQISGQAIDGGTYGATLQLGFLDIQSQTATQPAINLLGNTTGSGIKSKGGSLSHGMELEGGSTSGNGLKIDAAVSGAGVVILAKGTNLNGIEATGVGAGHGMQLNGGPDGDGLRAIGGATSGDGISVDGRGTGIGLNITSVTGDAISAISSGGGHGIHAEGANAKSGIHARGTGSGSGIHAETGSGGSGPGILSQGGTIGGAGVKFEALTGNNHGLETVGFGTGNGMSVTGGATGTGMLITGNGAGHGLQMNGAGVGSGMNIGSGGSAGAVGIKVVAIGDAIQAISSSIGDGFHVEGGGTGHGINALSGAGATGDGIHAESKATDGHGIYTLGKGSADGMRAEAGTNGAGFHGLGGTVTGSGAKLEAKVSGMGIHALGFGGPGTTGYGMFLDGDNTHGLRIDAGGAGSGVDINGNTGGHGIHSKGGLNGNGILTVGNGTGDGLAAEGGAGIGASGARFEGKGANNHGLETLRTGTGIDLKAAVHGDGSWETATSGSSIEKYPEGAIFFDPVAGSAGTVLGTNGTSDNPSSVEDDARTLAIALGTNKIFIAGGDYNVAGGSSKELKGFSLLGLDVEASLSIESNTSASFSKITSLDIAIDVNGTTGFPSNGIIEFVDSRFDVNGFKSTSSPLLAKHCEFVTSSVGGADEPVTLLDCFTDKSDILSLDALQTGAIMDVKRFVGNLKLVNETNAQTHHIHMQGGDIEIAASNTNGTVILTGWGTLTDNNGGMTVDKSAFAAISAGNTHSDMKSMNGVPGSAAKLEQGAAAIATGAAIAGTLSTTEMTTDLTELTNNHYKGLVVKWTTGVLAEQGTEITAYDGATKKLTFTAVTDAPSIADKFVIN